MSEPLTPAQRSKKAIEFFEKISAFEVNLYAIGIENRFTDPEELKKFKKLRLKWSFFVDQVQIDIATVLVDELQRLEPTFERGIESLRQTIDDLQSTVDFLNLLGNVLGVIGQIVNLVI